MDSVKEMNKFWRAVMGLDKSNSFIEDMKKFHKKYGLEYFGPARFLPEEISKFRINFLQEELDEYKACVAANDLEGQFDALVDLAVVLFGTSLLHGFPFEKGWDMVMEANNKKVRTKNPADSKRGSSFDIVKPEGWTPPALSILLDVLDNDGE